MKAASVAVFCLVASVCTCANAAIVPLWSPSTAAVTNHAGSVWTYQLQWHQSRGPRTGPITELGLAAHADPAQATSFTIHGFAGYVSGSCVAPVGWVCSARHVGSGAADVWHPDVAALVDLVWAYTSGPTIAGSDNLVDLGQFSARSTHTRAADVGFTGHTFRGIDTASDSVAHNTGLVNAPAALRLLVTEPASAGLAGLGLTLLMLQRRRRPR